MPPLSGETAGSSNTEIENSCKVCLAKFDSKEAKRAHMKEEWHVYNLKRHLASLDPISPTAFQEQVLSSKVEIDEGIESSSFGKSCDPCEQHYTSKKAWQIHLKSRNHIEKSASMSLEAPLKPSANPANSPEFKGAVGNSANEERAKFNPSQCLFCTVISTSLEASLKHMSHVHSFFIPDAEYLIDMESLLGYLYTVVSVFHECLLCGTERSNKFAIQDHMRDKGHCKVDFHDDEHELNQFYDFSGNGVEEETPADLVPDDDGELRLPSGKVVGHRLQARQSQQHRSERSSFTSSSQQQQLTQGVSENDSATPSTSTSTDRRVAMRAGTSTSLIGVPELQQRALRAVEHKLLKQETRAKTAYQHVLEREGNKQKRFKVKSIGKKQGGLEKRLG